MKALENALSANDVNALFDCHTSVEAKLLQQRAC